MTRVRGTVCLVGLVVLILQVPVVLRSPDATFGGSDPRLLALEVAAALSLLVIALIATPRVEGVLIGVVGAGWLVPELAGAVGVGLEARTVADAVPPLLVACLLTALVRRSGVSRSRLSPPVLLAVTGAVVAAASRLLLVDPFLDGDCWRTCRHNPLLVEGVGLGGHAELTGLLAMVGGVVWSAGLVLPAVARDRGWGGADLAGWTALGVLVVGLLRPPSDAGVVGGGSVTTFVMVQAALVGWLATLLVAAWRRWRLEVRLAHLLELMSDAAGPEALVRSLRRAVRDRDLRVCYWAPARGSYVDASGGPTDGHVPRPDQRVTEVARRGQRVAVIVHLRRIDGRTLERALRPAVRLALENEQLRAAALAELSELTGSRARVVERAALERRRLERNLHDGAQQRAVSLALLVRLFADRASAGDQAACRRMEVLTRTLVEELRRIARGIYPSVLADSGLLGGLLDLAERSEDLPVAVGEFPEARFPGPVETTAYLVLSAGIADARRRGATAVTVEASEDSGTLRVDLGDDASPAHVVPPDLVDQVRALGGDVLVDGSPGQRRMEVVLPCGS